MPRLQMRLVGLQLVRAIPVRRLECEQCLFRHPPLNHLLRLPEEAELFGESRSPRAKNREGRRKEGGTRGFDSRSVFLVLA